jgi:hypothetical protein
LNDNPETLALSLPPNDYITHLAQVTDHHVNSGCSIFDRTFFLERLNRDPAQSPLKTSEIWAIERYLVIALGKLFLERGATGLGPPGIREFLHVIKNLPSNMVLEQDPITAVESFCLLAIYAQAADMHRTAYLFVCLNTPCVWHSTLLC